MPLKFHKDTVSLLDAEPKVSSASLELIDRVERKYDFEFPASMREWYSLDGVLDIMLRHSNCDPPVAVDEMLTPRRDVMGQGSHDLLSQGLIPIRYENQACAVWAVELTGVDDPPVVVDNDTLFTEWKHCSDTFSNYVYAGIWDYRFVFFRDAVVMTDGVPFSASHIDFIANHFHEGRQTYGRPGDRHYRFFSDTQAMVIHVGDDRADWYLAASDGDALEDLIHKVGHLESLQDYLYAWSDTGKQVLLRMKADA